MPPSPGRFEEEDVLDYLERIVGRLERLGDRLESYADEHYVSAASSDQEGHDVPPPSAS